MNQLKSEWIKFKSLKSNWIVNLIILLLAILSSVLISWYMSDLFENDEYGLADFYGNNISPVWDTIAGNYQSWLIFVIIIVILIVTSEFKYGSIQVYIMTQSRRVYYYFIKLIFSTLYIIISFVVLIAIAFSITYSIYPSKYKKPFFEELQLGLPLCLNTLIATLLVMVTIYAFAFIFKNATPTILVFLFLFLILSTISSALAIVSYSMMDLNNGATPEIMDPTWLDWINVYLPGSALDTVTYGAYTGTSTMVNDVFNSAGYSKNFLIYSSFGALVIYALIPLIISTQVFKKRDLQ